MSKLRITVNEYDFDECVVCDKRMHHFSDSHCLPFTLRLRSVSPIARFSKKFQRPNPNPLTSLRFTPSSFVLSKG